jgi:tetratricopeptide (TPR) repeat protein
MFRRAARPLLALLVLLGVAGCRPHGLDALRRGDELLRAGKPAEAIPLLERAVTDLPSDARAWNHLGLAYHHAGRGTDALKAYLRALEKDRNLFDAWFNLGALSYEQGNWLEAERSLRTHLGVEANRTNAVAWRLLGLAQFATRQWDVAERSLGNATKFAPRDAEAWNGLGLIQVARNRPRDAQRTFTQVTQMAPEFGPGRLNLAIVTHQQLNDRRGALTHYRAYAALKPTPADAPQVETLIRQLEQALQPPPATNVLVQAAAPTNSLVRLATNLVSRATNATARAVVPTNPAPPVRSEAPAPRRETPAAAPAVTAETKPIPAVPKPEVVRVDEGPALVAARDSTSTKAPALVAAAVTTNPPVVIPDPSPANVADSRPPAAVASLPAETDAEAERRGFWSRANPVKWNWRWANPGNWFDGPEEAPPEKAATPLSRTSGRPTATASPTLSLPTATPVQPPPAPKPVVPRYTRQVATSIPAGNRTAAQAPFEAGLAAQDRRDLAAASNFYEQAVQADPAYFAAQHNLALVALDRNDLANALAASEAAVALQPTSMAARRLFASALQRANYPADAAEQLKQMLATSPDDAQSHLALAGLYATSLAEPALARPHYERVLELEPRHPQAASIRIWLAGTR